MPSPPLASPAAPTVFFLRRIFRDSQFLGGVSLRAALGMLIAGFVEELAAEFAEQNI